MKSNLTSKKFVFTVVELMVVLGLFCILAAILLPVLTKAKEEGKRIVCLSNVRQLAIAAGLYATNNNHYYPPLQQGSGWGTPDILWFGIKQSDGTFDPKGSVLYPYLKTGKIRWCPSFAQHNSTGCYGNATGGYGYNSIYIGTSAFIDRNYNLVRPAKTTWIRSPDETILFADCAYYDLLSHKIEEKYKLSSPCYEVSGRKLDANIHFRHSKRANLSFCDGHAKSKRWDYPGMMAHGADTSVYNLGFLSPIPIPSGSDRVIESDRIKINSYFDRK